MLAKKRMQRKCRYLDRKREIIFLAVKRVILVRP